MAYEAVLAKPSRLHKQHMRMIFTQDFRGMLILAELSAGGPNTRLVWACPILEAIAWWPRGRCL